MRDGAAPSRVLEAADETVLGLYAAVIGMSVSTVRKWEAGDKRPSGPLRKLFDLIARKGLEVMR